MNNFMSFFYTKIDFNRLGSTVNVWHEYMMFLFNEIVDYISYLTFFNFIVRN